MKFKVDLLEIYSRRLKVQKYLIMQVVALQEETLLFGITHKHIHWWDEKGDWNLVKFEFIQAIQQEKGTKDYHVKLFSDERMTQIHLETKHLAKIVEDPVDRVDEEWEHYSQIWNKLTHLMTDI